MTRGQNRYPAGWHPPMAPPDQLKEKMSSKKLFSFYDRELKAYGRAAIKPYGFDQSKKRLIKSPLQASQSLRDEPKSGPYGSGWWFQPFPLSQKEERLIVKRNRWNRLARTQFGDYFVAPSRYDLKWIQRIFWTIREIRGTIRAILSFPSINFEKELKEIRNQLHSLSPGNGKKSVILSKLTSDVFYCLRQCKTSKR